MFYLIFVSVISTTSISFNYYFIVSLIYLVAVAVINNIGTLIFYSLMILNFL